MRYGLIAVMLLLSGALTRATVIIPADLGTLSRDARAIARGRVVAVDAQWSDGRRGIETIVTLATEAYLKGGLGETIQFRVPGGLLGRYRSIVVGAPQFAVGQRVVVFLGAQGPMVPFILGLNQGVFRIAQDRGGETVTPPVPLPAADGPIVRGQVARAPQPLADFEREVRALTRSQP